MIIDESEARIASMYLIRHLFCTTYLRPGAGIAVGNPRLTSSNPHQHGNNPIKGANSFGKGMASTVP
jgi:hypothetical protein